MSELMQAVLSGERRWWIEHGNALFALRCLPAESVDSMVTDPPAGIAFMGRRWDSDKGGRDHWIAWLTAILRECYRVLKPGAHILVWSIPRTSHWTGTAVENAGFEPRDTIEHIFASGFPKSLNVSKAMDAAAGAERAVIGKSARHGGGTNRVYGAGMGDGVVPELTAPATESAKRWDGWGTALKPAHETWWLARKPVEKTIVTNILRHGTGAINIDASRVAHASPEDFAAHDAGVSALKQRGGQLADSWKNSSDLAGASDASPAGRWPANLVLSHAEGCEIVGYRPIKAHPTWATPNRVTESTFTGEIVSPVRHAEESIPEYRCADGCPVRELGRQSGESVSRAAARGGTSPNPMSWSEPRADGSVLSGHSDTGTAARYFHQFQRDALDDLTPFIYLAKPARAEKEAGLSAFAPVSAGQATGRQDGTAGLDSPRSGAGRTGGARNTHPTTKGRKLMAHFCRLITPPGGVVLDPFAGSGSTGVGALLGGFRFIGFELSDTAGEPFVTVARARLDHIVGGAVSPTEQARARRVEPRQCELFPTMEAE